MADQMSFTISAKTYSLSHSNVVDAMKGVDPHAISKYAVKVGSKRYPPKQVLSQTLGIPLIAFTTQYAYNILQRLGFEVEETR